MEKIGTFLKGDVYRLSVSEISKFFDDKYPYGISNSGVNSFLKSLKIPAPYFLKQPRETQLELLDNQKSYLNSDLDLIIMIQDNIVEYVSLSDLDLYKQISEKTPISNDWIPLEEDFKSGYLRYFMPSDTFKEDEFNMGVYIDFPILFSKPMIVSLGFYKLNKEDTSLNYEVSIPGTKIKIKSTQLPETDHNTYFLDLMIKMKNNNLDSILKHLEKIQTDSDICVNLLLSFEKDKLISKTSSKKIRKYIEKEQIPLENILELVQLASSFINLFKTYSSKFKFKNDFMNAILLKHNRLPNLDFLQDFTEGY